MKITKVLNNKSLCRKVGRMSALAGHTKLADKIGNCCSFVLKRKIRVKNGAYVTYGFIRISYCKDRLCPICQTHNRDKLFERNKTVAHNIVAVNKTAKFYHITFTIKNLAAINKNVIQDLRKAFSKIVKAKNVKQFLLGYFMSIEITYSEKNEFHPHIHALFAFSSTYSKGGNYLSGDKWLALWRKAVNGKYVTDKVDIKNIRNVSGTFIAKNKKGEKFETTTAQSLATEMYYITKHVQHEDYTTKKRSEADNAKILSSLYEAVNGKTLVSSSGIFKGFISEYRKIVEPQLKLEHKQESEILDNSKIFTTEQLRYSKNGYVPYDDNENDNKNS